MTVDDLERERREVIRVHGPWTHHNVRLGDGLDTIGGDPQPSQSRRLLRLVQAVADVVDKPFEELRVLDLACHEGLNALEFGARGAEVLGIEARRDHVVKADFAKRALGLERSSSSPATCGASALLSTGGSTWCSAWGSSTTSIPRTSSSCSTACRTSACALR